MIVRVKRAQSNYLHCIYQHQELKRVRTRISQGQADLATTKLGHFFAKALPVHPDLEMKSLMPDSTQKIDPSTHNSRAISKSISEKSWPGLFCISRSTRDVKTDTIFFCSWWPVVQIRPIDQGLLQFFCPIPCTYTSLLLGGVARNFFNYMDMQDHAIFHVWIHFIPTSLQVAISRAHVICSSFQTKLSRFYFFKTQHIFYFKSFRCSSSDQIGAF